jgi:hypothetical protein
MVDSNTFKLTGKLTLVSHHLGLKYFQTPLYCPPAPPPLTLHSPQVPGRFQTTVLEVVVETVVERTGWRRRDSSLHMWCVCDEGCACGGESGADDCGGYH